MAVLTPITLANSIGRGHQFHWVEANQWGNLGTGGAGNASQIITVPNGIVGAAIGPVSTVEGVHISWYTGNKGPQIAPGNLWTFRDADVLVTREAPFVGRLPGPITIRVLPQDIYGDEYIPADPSAAMGDFGGVVGANMLLPYLQLLLAIEGEPVQWVTTRHPLQIFNVGFAMTGTGTIDQVAIWPVAGRKTIRVTLATADTEEVGHVGYDYQLSGIMGNATANLSANVNLREHVLQIGTLNAPGTHSFVIDKPVQYLMLKVEALAAAAAGPYAMRYSIDARDE